MTIHYYQFLWIQSSTQLPKSESVKFTRKQCMYFLVKSILLFSIQMDILLNFLSHNLHEFVFIFTPNHIYVYNFILLPYILSISCPRQSIPIHFIGFRVLSYVLNHILIFLVTHSNRFHFLPIFF